MPRFRPTLVTAALALGVFGLTACATGASTAPLSPTTSATPVPSATVATPTASSTAGIDRPSIQEIDCDSMLDPAIAEGLRAQGLSPAPKSWSQFGFEPTAAALECPWGDAGSTASSVFYAWAALEDGQDEEFITLALENGYLAEQTAQETWITAPPEAAGGGEIATLVTPEWVAFADTRSQIRDIVWTR